jgi:hypothetical protein
MQYCLTGFGTLAFILVFFWLPETWHGETPHAKACRDKSKRFVVYWFNPLSSVALLRWPNVACIVSTQGIWNARRRFDNETTLSVDKLGGGHDLYLCCVGTIE